MDKKKSLIISLLLILLIIISIYSFSQIKTQGTGKAISTPEQIKQIEQPNQNPSFIQSFFRSIRNIFGGKEKVSGEKDLELSPKEIDEEIKTEIKEYEIFDEDLDDVYKELKDKSLEYWQTKPQSNYSNNTIIVKFKPNRISGLPTRGYISTSDVSLPDSIQQLVAKDGITKIKKIAIVSSKTPSLEDVVVMKLDTSTNVEEVIKDLQKDSNVEYVEYDYIFYANDPLFPIMWSLDNTGQNYPNFYESFRTPDADIDYPEALDSGFGQEEIVVAVIDSGVDYNHEDLAENMWVNEDEIPNNGIDDDDNGFIDDIYGYDFINNDNNPIDDCGHGTHCSGTIAAETDNGIGISGVCPNCKIMALKFLNSGGSGYTSDVLEALTYAINNNAKITSNSYGGGEYDQTFQNLINDAYNAGMIFVVSAGNGYKNLDYYPYYPASYNNALTVAAIDSDDKKPSFSNYGFTIDVSAPGVDILSLRANGTDMYGNSLHIFNEEGVEDPSGKYYVGSGTSMACPNAVGLVGLIWSHNPIWTNDQVTEQIKTYSDDIDYTNPDYSGLLGDGRINAYYALNSILPQANLRLNFDNPESLKINEEHSLTLNIKYAGVTTATNLEVDFYVNNELYETQTIPSINPGDGTNINFFWTPTELYYHNISFHISGLSEELYLVDNYLFEKIWIYNYDGFVITEDNYVFDCATNQNPEGHPIEIIVGPSVEYGFGIRFNNLFNGEIKNCVIKSFSRGVYLYNSFYTIITNNTASGNDDAIYLKFSQDNIITNNTVNENEGPGIYLDSSFYTIITNNTANENEGPGIYLEFSSNNTIINNTVNENGDSGIYLDSSLENIITNNTANENSGWRGAGIKLYSSSNNNIITNNTVNGNGAGIRLYFSSNNNNITNNTANENHVAIWLYSSSSNIITNNTANESYDGIFLHSSSDNIVTHNTAKENDMTGISLSQSSSNNLITNNIVANGNYYGIVLRDSSNNIITNNTANENRGYGIYLRDFSNNTITNNTANGNGWGGIFLRDSSNNNIITNNTMCDNSSDFKCEDGLGNNGSGNRWTTVTQCPDGWPVYNESYCHCNETWDEELQSCVLAECSDGTLYRECSSNQPLYCNNGELINNCQECGCSSNETCQQDGNCVIPYCLDNTPHENCSLTQPLYCNNGELINNCQECGCPSDYSCYANGNCYPPGGGSSGCFEKGSKIYTPQGYKAIESIKPRDIVYSFDDFDYSNENNNSNKGLNLKKAVVNKLLVHENFEDPAVVLILSNGIELNVTLNHPFYDPVAKLYKPLWKFNISNNILYYNDSLETFEKIIIKNIFLRDFFDIEYNLEVNDTHNFLVDGIVVHNDYWHHEYPKPDPGNPLKSPVPPNVTDNYSSFSKQTKSLELASQKFNLFGWLKKIFGF